MTTYIRPAVVLTLAFTLLTGIAYPLAITAIAQIAFPAQAGGSMIHNGDAIAGSALIGQSFTLDKYFWSRPSSAGQGYDASASSGSNLGPTSAKLVERTNTEIERFRAAGLTGQIPADAATASGSGLDPHISPEFAKAQIAHVARARGLRENQISVLVDRFTEGRLFGIIGEPRVNVLLLNLALDAAKPS